jgi:hypothetical protein
MTERMRPRRGPKDAIVCGDIGERYVGRHAGDPDPDDEGFCLCGLGLDAWVHTDTTRYVEMPLSALERFASPGGVARSEVEGQWRPVEPVHSLACTMLDGACRSMHCPFCGVTTGPQGHLCPERPR